MSTKPIHNVPTDQSGFGTVGVGVGVGVEGRADGLSFAVNPEILVCV